MDIGTDDNPTAVNVKGATNVGGVITAQGVHSVGDIRCDGTFYHSGNFNPPLAVPAHDHDNLYYRQQECDNKYPLKAQVEAAILADRTRITTLENKDLQWMHTQRLMLMLHLTQF